LFDSRRETNLMFGTAREGEIDASGAGVMERRDGGRGSWLLDAIVEIGWRKLVGTAVESVMRVVTIVCIILINFPFSL